MKRRLILFLVLLLAALPCLPAGAEDLSGMSLEQLRELQRQLDLAISEKQGEQPAGSDPVDALAPDTLPAPAVTEAPAPVAAPEPSVPIASLTVAAPKQPLPVSADLDLSALVTVRPEGASKAGLKYTVSDPSLASVSADGVLTGRKGGSVSVTVSDPASGKKASVRVQIVVPATKLTVTPGSADVFKGKTLKLSAELFPASVSNKKVVWESEDPDIARVSANGTVTGVSEGTTWIFCRAQDGSYQSGVCHVRVTVPVKKINIASRSMTLFKGDSTYASASVEPADATNANLDWSSSNDRIASVSSTGRVTAKSVGSCTLTAAAKDGSGVKAKITAYVEPTLPLYTDYLHWRTVNYAKTGQFSLDVISNCVNSKIKGFTAEVKCYISATSTPSVSNHFFSRRTVSPGKRTTTEWSYYAADGLTTAAIVEVTIWDVYFSDGTYYYIPKGDRQTVTFRMNKY